MTGLAPRGALVGATAGELVAKVQAGEVTATEVVAAHLERIAAVDSHVGAFQLVRAASALAEAAALDRRDDLSTLPLAGVPIAVKDNVDVAGEPTRCGSITTSGAAQEADHPLVVRLRAAGAVVVGKTRAPELCAWPFTDGLFGVTRSPWDLTRAAGGSSGGSGAAVAAGMVPLAHGSDGGGSVRIPAAACGLFGMIAGTGVVPGDPGRSGWNGLSANGTLATTVSDAALGLAVMAGRPDLAHCAVPDRPLRIAVSALPWMPVDVHEAFLAAVWETAELLAACGHEVREADPSYASKPLVTAGVRASAGIAEDAAGVPLRRFERRNRPVVLAGRVIRRTGWLRTAARDRFRAEMAEFFSGCDLLLTPTLADFPVVAEGWVGRGLVPNVRAARFAAFTGAWNVAGFPAAAVPVTRAGCPVPPSVQLVGPPGAEARVLSVAHQLEQERGWQRHPTGQLAGLVVGVG